MPQSEGIKCIQVKLIVCLTCRFVLKTVHCDKYDITASDIVQVKSILFSHKLQGYSKLLSEF